MLYLPPSMAKTIFSYVAVCCLLVLISANAINISLKKRNLTTDCVADLADEPEDKPVPLPLEEDTTGEDDESSRLVSQQPPPLIAPLSGKLHYANYFLTSFHYLEIISPPPQV